MTNERWHERTRSLLTLDGCDQQEEFIEIGRIDTDETICYVPFAVEGVPSKTPEGRSEAHARLIAKAPEMRDLIERMLEWPIMGMVDQPEYAVARALLAEIDGDPDPRPGSC